MISECFSVSFSIDVKRRKARFSRHYYNEFPASEQEARNVKRAPRRGTNQKVGEGGKERCKQIVYYGLERLADVARSE